MAMMTQATQEGQKTYSSTSGTTTKPKLPLPGIQPAPMLAPGTVPTTQQQTSAAVSAFAPATTATLQQKATALPPPPAPTDAKPITEGRTTATASPTAVAPNMTPGAMPLHSPGFQLPSPVVQGALPMQGTGQTALTPFGPGNDLRFTQIAPGQGADRFQMARDRFDQFSEATNPAYEAMIRRATQQAAANGRLGSGMLTTTYGDIAGDRAREMDLAKRGFLTDALEGTIGDGRFDRAELRGERGFQVDTQQRAFEDELRRLLVGDQLTGSAFGRNMDLAGMLGQLGFGGNPSNALLAGSQFQQGKADQSFDLLGQLLGMFGQQSTQGG